MKYENGLLWFHWREARGRLERLSGHVDGIRTLRCIFCSLASGISLLVFALSKNNFFFYFVYKLYKITSRHRYHVVAVLLPVQHFIHNFKYGI